MEDEVVQLVVPMDNSKTSLRLVGQVLFVPGNQVIEERYVSCLFS